MEPPVKELFPVSSDSRKGVSLIFHNRLRQGVSFTGASLDVGTQPHSFGYGGTGKKSTARQFEDYGQAYGQVGIMRASHSQ